MKKNKIRNLTPSMTSINFQKILIYEEGNTKSQQFCLSVENGVYTFTFYYPWFLFNSEIHIPQIQKMISTMNEKSCELFQLDISASGRGRAFFLYNGLNNVFEIHTEIGEGFCQSDCIIKLDDTNRQTLLEMFSHML